MPSDISDNKHIKSPVKIVFHTPALDVRGTCVSCYDYAHYNEVILGNKSIILTKNIPERKKADNPFEIVESHDDEIIAKFQRRFQVLFYTEGVDDIDDVILRNGGCDILYTIKYGTKKDAFLSKYAKNVIHCVFVLHEPHGDVYAGVSEALAKKFGKGQTYMPYFVPHMISLTPSRTGENMREELGIPKDAIVFGRSGGSDSFNLKFAWKVIADVAVQFPNIYFVFVNAPRMVNHPSVIYIDKIIDNDDKNKFISTCDACLECGTMGHTFGIAIGEFSVNNKPVIAYDDMNVIYCDSHLQILGDKGIYYRTPEDFYHILTTFDPKLYLNKDLNCYRQFSPEIVMEKFDKVFIQG